MFRPQHSMCGAQCPGSLNGESKRGNRVVFEGNLLTPLNADYVVVDAGTSGCVVARRLLDRPGVSVLLIEAGAAHPGLPLDVPMAGLRLRGGDPGRFARLSNRI
ncbi:MAG: GMC family oxidoreductase N-terminal domain-containing protein [Pirellulaceae bacterium]|nr:GMC family oxidoreductase N-terminal domain-containing protein [Pirellulaceae bacterium]